MIRGSVDIPSLCRGNATCPLRALLATAEPKVMFRFGEDKPTGATQHVTRVSQALESRIKDPKCCDFPSHVLVLWNFEKRWKDPKWVLSADISWLQMLYIHGHIPKHHGFRVGGLNANSSTELVLCWHLHVRSTHELLGKLSEMVRTNSWHCRETLSNCRETWSIRLGSIATQAPATGGGLSHGLFHLDVWANLRRFEFQPMPSAKKCTRSCHQIPRFNVTVSIQTILSSSCYFILVGNTCHRMSRWQ